MKNRRTVSPIVAFRLSVCFWHRLVKKYASTSFYQDVAERHISIDIAI